MEMHCDNQVIIHIATNPIFREWTQHIKLDCYVAREEIQFEQLHTPFMSSYL